MPVRACSLALARLDVCVCVCVCAAQVPPLFRSLSIEFEGKLGFGMATASDKNLMANFGVKKVPSVLILFPDMKQEMQDGKAAMQGMQFTPQVRRAAAPPRRAPHARARARPEDS